MIGRIQGILLEKQAPELLIDIQGVGYEVQVPMTTYYQLPQVGEQIKLHTHFVVREDAQILYGFFSLSDRHLFRQLIRINGVGPKMALAILSGMNTAEFAALVLDNDVTGLTRLPGVGKKTAERLVIEMRDKVDVVDEHASDEPVNVGSEVSAAGKQRQSEKDAVAALVSLGYSPQQASKAVSRIAKTAENSEQMIRLALQSV
ncbi:MAG TPA: Holliday junction branch migration protein RuvA [Aeromonadales bacterium]|nr:Holliday junction branch migration protein RuvA [Aeromonadales bacterium]